MCIYINISHVSLILRVKYIYHVLYKYMLLNITYYDSTC